MAKKGGRPSVVEYSPAGQFFADACDWHTNFPRQKERVTDPWLQSRGTFSACNAVSFHVKQFAIAGELDDARKAQRDANGRLVFGAWTLRCNKCPTNFLTSLFDNSPAVVF